MPPRSSSTLQKSISVEDVIGAPSINPTSGESGSVPKPQDVDAVNLPAGQSSPPKPNAFVPGLIGTVPAHQQQYSANNNGYSTNAPTKTVLGFLDVMQEGHGFLGPKFIAGEGD